MYQLLWLNDRDSEKKSTLHSVVEKGIEDLGIASEEFLAVLSGLDNLDLRFPIVSVWFGGSEDPEEAELGRLRALLEEGCAVFPVVQDYEEYTRLVPEDLFPINGFEWRDDPTRLAGSILRAFGLTREQRKAFVSYRRADSEAVAVQLFHRLADCGYRTFLDTASIDFGVHFQESLWERMSDSDLLVFLDTPGAVGSRWVEAELMRANHLGLGVLQVVWPENDPTPGTDLSIRFQLHATDFAASLSPYTGDGERRANPDARLSEEAATAIADAAEGARLRSLGSRRERIVGEILAGAARHRCDATVEPTGGILLRLPSSEGKAWPVIGLPTAESIYQSREPLDPGGEEVRLVYDGLGMSRARQEFLAWLDEVVPDFRCVSLEGLDDWLRSIS